VLAHVPLADYLRARLARYDLALQVPRSRLPLRIELAGPEIRSALITDPSAAPPPPGTGPGSALEALDGPSTLREWGELQARVVALEDEADAARRRAEALAERFSAEVASGAITLAPEDDAAAGPLGRPGIRGAGLLWTLTLVVGATVLAEAWAIAVPMLLLAGAYPPPFAGPGALEAAVHLAFALGAAVGLLALAFLALGAAEAMIRGAGPKLRRRLATAGALLALLAAGAAAEATALDAPRSGIPPASHAILLLALPLGAALATRRAQREHAARAEEVAAALAWDRERAGALGARARRLEELAWAEGDARAAQRRVVRARARAAALARRAEAAARLLERAGRRALREQLRLAQSLLAALERDRYEYLRQAAERLPAEATAAPAPVDEPRPAVPDRGEGSGRVAV
jgi:hypothetical protein